MKLTSGICFAAALALASSFAMAQTADDIKWVNKCIADNKNEGAKPEVVRKYCECMNDKMDDNERKSVTEWEKTHKKEMDECSKAAGWK